MPEWSPSAGAHPDLETLAAYADGAVSVREKAAVEAHLAGCEECFDVVSELGALGAIGALGAPGAGALGAGAPGAGAAGAGALRASPEPAANVSSAAAVARVVPLGKRRGFLWGAAGLATAAIVLLAVWSNVTSRRASDSPVATLVSVVGPSRSIEARLTGGFPYAELKPSTRSSEGIENYSLRAEAGKLAEEARVSPTSRNLHALGVAQLLLGRHVDAVQSLLAAAEETPNNANLLSDLSASYLAVGTQLARPADLNRALEFASRAAESPESPVEALFNRALILERLNRRAEAIRAWQEYLRHDSSSEWSAEARRRLERLNQSTSVLVPLFTAV